MASIENVCSARLISCTIEGVGLVNRLVRTITIKESVCCPYLTGEILLLDNDNVINNENLRGGNIVHINFDGADRSGPAYKIDMRILHFTAVSSPENFNLKIYTISLVSSEYFTDRGKTVSADTSQYMNGVQLIQNIWGACGFEFQLEPVIPDESMQDGNQPFYIAQDKPLTAIGKIRDIQVYPDRTGNVLLFHQRAIVDGKISGIHHVVLGPLAVIYPTSVSTQTFYQRETWGIKWQHMFGADGADAAIISLNQQSRTIMLDLKEFAPNADVATDQNAGKLSVNQIGQGILQGPNPSHMFTNSDRVEAAHDPAQLMANARRYASCMKSEPPKYLVRVPLKTGLNITAGGACFLDMQPTHQNPNARNPFTGAYFITDLIHECHNDLREVSGTTTFNAIKKEYCNV